MPPAKRRTLRFVRALVGGATAIPRGVSLFAVTSANGAVTLDARQVAALSASGVLCADADGGYRATADARSWLRRQLAETDAFADQHRTLIRGRDGTTINLEESPLARLAVAGSGETEPFLSPRHVEAGERVRRLAERARLQPRVTMSYDGTPVSGRGAPATAAEITDLAAEARTALGELPRVLPPDCAGVVLDVCGLLKGLQTVESERGWPRRSAKLVLRIGLDQLARHYGYAEVAEGPRSRGNRVWSPPDARPADFP